MMVPVFFRLSNRLHDPATVRQTRRGLQVVVGTLSEASIAAWQSRI